MTEDKKPSEAPKGSGILAFLVFVLVLCVGAIGFTVSWDNLFEIAKPAFKGTLETDYVSVAWAHAIPAVVDGGIVAVTLLRLWNATNGRRLTFASYFLAFLISATIVINATAGDTWLSMLLHALPATVYVAVSEMFIHSLLKRYKRINNDKPKKAVTFARWVLAPVSTFIMWRIMTIASSDDLSVFVRLERLRVTQHHAWRREHGAAWWVPMLGVSKADRAELRMRLLELSVGTTEPQNQNRENQNQETAEPATVLTGTPEPEPQNRPEPLTVLGTAKPEPQNRARPEPKPRAKNRPAATPDGMVEKEAAIEKALDDWYADDDRPSIGNQGAIAKYFGVAKATVSRINKEREARILAAKTATRAG